MDVFAKTYSVLWFAINLKQEKNKTIKNNSGNDSAWTWQEFLWIRYRGLWKAFISGWQVCMHTKAEDKKLRWLFWLMGSKHCDWDRSVWTSKETMLKNKPSLLLFHENNLVMALVYLSQPWYISKVHSTSFVHLTVKSHREWKRQWVFWNVGVKFLKAA